ncbi:MAG: ggdef domain [Planctomycetota bacterium]|nr:MAG: ggdef domain [Planctomycetota bacterium]
MRLIYNFFRALACGHTYNLHTNPEAWFGLLWGLPIPVFSFALDGLLLGWENRTIASILSQHPWQLVFLTHPPLFAIVFGAMGTIRRDLETHNRQLIARLELDALTDPLTGVHNRRFVLEELDKAAARAGRSAETVAVVMFDMDNFKIVNDTQGHLAGDKLLKEVAAAIRDSLRRGDTLGRYGGDEFLLVAPGSREGALSVAERARQTVRERTSHSISAGVALSGEDGKSPAELIAAADRDLAAAKKRLHVGRPETRKLVP